MLSYIKPICHKNVLHKRHGQLGFHFLVLFLKHGKELESIIFLWHIFCGIKAQSFGDKKSIVSVPYITVFGFLAYNSLHILKSYDIISLTLKLVARGIPSIETISSLLVLSQIWDFPGCF